MSGYFYVTYNGNKTKYLFNKSTAFDWTDYSVTLTDVTDPTLRIYCYCRDASIYLADIMISFTLNKDETQTKKTTVDGELTVGKTKFVPMPTASEGLNIVILD